MGMSAPMRKKKSLCSSTINLPPQRSPPMNGKMLWQQGYEEKNNSLAPMGFAVFTQEV